MDDRQPSNALLPPGEELSPTEQEVIDEYVRLADNMKKVSTHIEPQLQSKHLLILTFPSFLVPPKNS